MGEEEGGHLLPGLHKEAVAVTGAPGLPVHLQASHFLHEPHLGDASLGVEGELLKVHFPGGEADLHHQEGVPGFGEPFPVKILPRPEQGEVRLGEGVGGKTKGV